jgi:hypothetical protein
LWHLCCQIPSVMKTQLLPNHCDAQCRFNPQSLCKAVQQVGEGSPIMT